MLHAARPVQRKGEAQLGRCRSGRPGHCGQRVGEGRSGSTAPAAQETPARTGEVPRARCPHQRWAPAAEHAGSLFSSIGPQRPEARSVANRRARRGSRQPVIERPHPAKCTAYAPEAAEASTIDRGWKARNSWARAALLVVDLARFPATVTTGHAAAGSRSPFHLAQRTGVVVSGRASRSRWSGDGSADETLPGKMGWRIFSSISCSKARSRTRLTFLAGGSGRSGNAFGRRLYRLLPARTARSTQDDDGARGRPHGGLVLTDSATELKSYEEQNMRVANNRGHSAADGALWHPTTADRSSAGATRSSSWTVKTLAFYRRFYSPQQCHSGRRWRCNG
jgi:hypothetical protein